MRTQPLQEITKQQLVKGDNSSITTFNKQWYVETVIALHMQIKIVVQHNHILFKIINIVFLCTGIIMLNHFLVVTKFNKQQKKTYVKQTIKQKCLRKWF